MKPTDRNRNPTKGVNADEKALGLKNLFINLLGQGESMHLREELGGLPCRALMVMHSLTIVVTVRLLERRRVDSSCSTNDERATLFVDNPSNNNTLRGTGHIDS